MTMADLLVASKNGYLTKVNELLENGHSVKFRDRDNATALYWAACRGYGKICLALISANSEIEARVKWGSTPLHAAADRGHTECVKILIKSGVEINAQNLRGDSPLHLASYRGHTEIVEILIRARTNPFLLNDKNKTPAQEAKGQNYLRITEILQQYMEGKQLPGFMPYMSENFSAQHKSLERSASDNVRRNSLDQSTPDSSSHIYFPSAASQCAYSKLSNVEFSENITDPEPESSYYRQIAEESFESGEFHDNANIAQYTNLRERTSEGDSSSKQQVLRKSIVDRIKSEEPRSPLSWDESSLNRAGLHSEKQNGKFSSRAGTFNGCDAKTKKVKRLASSCKASEATSDTDPMKSPAEKTSKPLPGSSADTDRQASSCLLGSDTRDSEKKSIKQKYVSVEKFTEILRQLKAVSNYADNLQMKLVAANDRVERLETQMSQSEMTANANEGILTEAQSCDNPTYEISILKAKLNEESRLRNLYEIRCEKLMAENRKLQGAESSESASRLLPRGRGDNLCVKSEYNFRNLENTQTGSPDIIASNCDTSPYGIGQDLNIITNCNKYKNSDTSISNNSNVNCSYNKSDLLDSKCKDINYSCDIKTRSVSENRDKGHVSQNVLALENPFTFASSLMLKKSENADIRPMDTKAALFNRLDAGIVYDGFGETMHDFNDFSKNRNAIF